MGISGGAPAPAPFDPEREARAQLMLEQERARIAEQQRVAEEARRAEEQARKRAEFDTNLSNARTGAFGRAEQSFRDVGADPTNYVSLIDEIVGNTARSVPLLDPNPQAYFNSSINDAILGRARERDQFNFRNQFNEFAPTGFAENRIGSTLDDPILESILASQFDDANSQIRRAFDRGNLNEVGFQSALSGLENQRTAGRAALTGIGDSVLEQGRGRLRSIADEGRGQIDAYRVGQQFDPSSYRGRLDTAFSEFQGGLEGNIRNAVGGQMFFDPTTLIGRGGVAQGVTNNPTAGSLAEAMARREDERNRTRGLGSQGAF